MMINMETEFEKVFDQKTIEKIIQCCKYLFWNQCKHRSTSYCIFYNVEQDDFIAVMNSSKYMKQTISNSDELYQLLVLSIRDSEILNNLGILDVHKNRLYIDVQRFILNHLNYNLKFESIDHDYFGYFIGDKLIIEVDFEDFFYNSNIIDLYMNSLDTEKMINCIRGTNVKALRKLIEAVNKDGA